MTVLRCRQEVTLTYCFQWKFEKVGDHRYRLSVAGYPHTGVLEDKVIASLDPKHETEWDIVRHEYQNAYT